MKKILILLIAVLLLPSAVLADSGTWQSRMTFPSASQIAARNRQADRAPYALGWMNSGKLGRFSEYVIDFKADYVPSYTYCSLFNFYIDYSSMKSKYAKVHTAGDGISGYAGVQQRGPDEAPNTILSFWDVECEDKDGRVVRTVRPTLVYPEGDQAGSFDNEGNGAQYLPKYNWKSGQWYRMLIQIGTSEKTGNTTVQQWLMEISVGEWTKICEYDLGMPGLAFIGEIGIFLENFNPAASGEIRTLEFKNVRACKEYSADWKPITSGTFDDCFGWPGSYTYGSSGDTFWMITSGVTGLVKTPKKHLLLKVNGVTKEKPY